MKTTLLLLALSAVGLAQEKTAAPDPIPAELVKQVALAQRDYVIAKGNLDTAVTRLQSLTAEAGKACEKAGKMFNAETVSCAEKPTLGAGGQGSGARDAAEKK